MQTPVNHRRRLRAVGASVAAAALVAGSAMTALAAPDGEYLGSASDFGLATPAAPSIEAQLAEYGDRVMPNRWMVQLSGSDGQKLVRDAKQQGVDVKVLKSYDKVWKGVSVSVDDAAVGKLARVAGVQGVFPVLEVERPVRDAEPMVEYGKQLTGADVANEELGFTGKGVKVGIIDSGIDYNHPDLGGSGVDDETLDFPNARVQYGHDFVGDAYDTRKTDDPAALTPMPDQFPDDCGGHGTHVAGITGANGAIKGVAPDVTFGAYRVFGCDGPTSSDVIVEAMEMAKADGMDVVNMSLGASYATWPSYPTAVAADQLVADGVTVVVSQGNEGTGGTFSSGAPAVAHDVISVGSVDNSDYMADYITTEAGTEYPFMTASESAPWPKDATFGLTAADPINGCENVAPATGEGQALIVQRGDCTFHAKALAAQEAGYDALFIYNNTGGVINATVEGTPAITIPVATLLQADGEKLVAEAPTSFTTSSEQKRFENPTGGYQSDFSSYGLAADLTLKPDVSAPGGSIYSTVPLENGGYDTMGGTSMSAPHVAGAVALLLEAKPDLTPLQVRTTLMNTADPFVWGTVADLGALEPVHRQGAGMIDIPQAIMTAVSVEESKISLGEGEAGPVTTTLTVTNSSDEEKTFEIGVEHGVATYGPTNEPGFYVLDADVEFSADSVTVPAGQKATFTVVIGEDFGVDGAIYGGWVTLTNGGERYVVPFAGLSGDYQALVALDVAAMAYGDPDENLNIAEPFHVYSMVGEDLPYVYFNLAYPTEAVHFDVYKANPDGTKGEKVHSNFVNYATFLQGGRLEAATVIAWDGTYQGNQGKNGKLRRVADGDYVLEVRVLKALGDPANPDHWETWDSTAFTIAYGDGADTDAGNGPKPGKGKGKGPKQ